MYILCVHACIQRVLWRCKKSLRSAFKMPLVGLVETETFFSVALLWISNWMILRYGDCKEHTCNGMSHPLCSIKSKTISSPTSSRLFAWDNYKYNSKKENSTSRNANVESDSILDISAYIVYIGVDVVLGEKGVHKLHSK